MGKMCKCLWLVSPQQMESSGFGACRPFSQSEAQSFLGDRLDDLIALGVGVAPRAASLECPLWDLLGNRTGRPVYHLLAESVGKTVSEPLRVPCYDTSLYIDDLHLTTDDEGAALIASEARFGYEHGHRSFKIKVGRGARHMPLLGRQSPRCRRDQGRAR